ncbi:hypothetical protein HMPREF9412_5735 [Paenibacillus sp. HGF5]|nr:hypothetical protein HMPREF9412_5735 [Paenibacillus sp. HGF5]
MMDVSLCAKLPWGSFLLFKRVKVNGRSSVLIMDGVPIGNIE